MLTEFQWFSLLAILGVTLGGGWLPLTRPEQARQPDGFPLGKPFSCGVFLALSLVMMLPSGFHLFNKAYPDAVLPLPPVIAASVFLLLLFMEHREEELASRGARADGRTSPTIPIIMTVMIAIPSFLLGTALGVSGTIEAVMIFLAIIAHKGTAGFALAVKMVKSSMSRKQVYLLYLLFACSTPLGIITGQEARGFLPVHEMLEMKGVILSAAAGVFLYMSTMHGLRDNPLIVQCRHHRGFFAMVVGFALTVGVRLLIGEAHRL
ncbi:ZIP family metal transporter [Pseudodesulfovibrio sp.]|nr:ZIP family metal transporter [Pseudodesulfovibrio sp.]